jgi:peptidoglycan/LPS O-acetylase OafA/YrhL
MIVPAVAVWSILTFFPQWTWYDQEDELVGEMVVVMDMLWGVTIGSFLIYTASRALNRAARRPPVLRLLESRPAVALGTFSYSLYLVHMPLVKLVWAGLEPLGWPRMVNYGLMVAVAIPLTLAVGYAFYRLLERPFLGKPISAAPAPDPRGGDAVMTMAG